MDARGDQYPYQLEYCYLHISACSLWRTRTSILALFLCPILMCTFYVPMIMNTTIAIYDLHTAFASVLLVALIAFALYVSAQHTTLALIASRCLSTRDAEDVSSDIGAYSSALLQNDYPQTSLRAKWFQKAFDVSAYTLLFLVPFYVALHMNYLTLILPDIDISSKSLSGGLNGGAIALLTAEASGDRHFRLPCAPCIQIR